METKNICGKIPVELHEKVREELEGTEMTKKCSANEAYYIIIFFLLSIGTPPLLFTHFLH